MSHHPEHMMKNDAGVYTLSEQVSRVSLSGVYDNSERVRGAPSRNEASEEFAANQRYENHAADPRNHNAITTTNTVAPYGGGTAFENVEDLDPRKRKVVCRACRFQIDAEKPSFQCLKCINYILCGECYMGMLTSPSGFADNHVKDENAADDHKFEGIPPMNLLMRGGRKMHWEKIIGPIGEISTLFFDVMDAWLEYLDEYHSPGVTHMVSATAFLQTGDIWNPIDKRGPLAIEAQFGDTLTKAGIVSSFPETLRSHFISGGVQFYEYWSPPRDWSPEKAALVRRFMRDDKGPYLNRRGIYEAWFLSLIRDPDDLYGNFIAMLDYMPSQYTSRLPPGRPHRALFPPPVLGRGEYGVYDLEGANLSFYKFPPGKELFPNVRRR